MSFQKFKSKSSYVSGINHSAKTNIVGDITSKNRKNLTAQWSICKRTKSLTVNDFTFAADCLHDYLTHLGKSALPDALHVGKKVFRRVNRWVKIF